MHFYHVTFVGVNRLNEERVLLTVALVVFTEVVRRLLHALLRGIRRIEKADRFRFWGHQAINLASAAFFILALISIWVGPHANWGTFAGLIGAGIAFASQQFILAIAGYFVILRGRTFSLGDRIIIGGVRGEVIALDFFQTTVLEMGQPPAVESETDPAMWVLARQYTGRIVVISNGEIFKQPVFNYSRDFAFLWEEIHVGIAYDDDYQTAEQILLETAQKHSAPIEELTRPAQAQLIHLYDIEPPSVQPRVFYRMTSNWVDLAVRFIVRDRDIRIVKDAMYREILRRFKERGIEVASSTYDIVGFPPVRVEMPPAAPPESPKQP